MSGSVIHSSVSPEIILGKLQTILQEILTLEGTQSLRPEARLREDLHIDSLGMVDLVIGVEETFGIKIRSDVNLLERIVTVRDAVDLVRELSPSAR